MLTKRAVLHSDSNIPAGPLTQRIVLLDHIRGFTLLNMIAYHALWDLTHLFDVSLPWYDGLGAYVWQQAICWTFILLSGFCWPMGKRPLKRGLTLVVCSGLICLTTVLMVPDQPIYFGVLTLLSVCTLLLIPLERLLRHVPPAAGAAVSALLFAVTRNLGQGQLGFEGWVIAQLPDQFYYGWAAAFLGFPDASFRSSDYFPLLPWMFLFAAGYFLKRMLPDDFICRFPLRAGPIAFLGRHSLTVYLLHQPVLYLVGCLFF